MDKIQLDLKNFIVRIDKIAENKFMASICLYGGKIDETATIHEFFTDIFSALKACKLVETAADLLLNAPEMDYTPYEEALRDDFEKDCENKKSACSHQTE